MKKMIVTTSTSCVGYLDKPANVVVLPLNIQIAGQNYVEHKSIDIDSLYQRLSDNPSLEATTSPPHEGQLLEFFYDLVEQGVEEIMVITLAAKLSKTYQNIRSIQAIFGNRLKIHLFDSRTVGYTEALLVYEASRMLEEEKDFFEIVLQLNRLRDKQRGYMIVDNLKAMIRTKRISAPAGFFANLFSIKPIVYMKDTGEFVPIEKIRTFEKSLYRMVEVASNESRGKRGKFYVAVNDQNAYLPTLHAILSDFGIKNIAKVPFSSVAIMNAGANSMGIIFVED